MKKNSERWAASLVVAAVLGVSGVGVTEAKMRSEVNQKHFKTESIRVTRPVKLKTRTIPGVVQQLQVTTTDADQITTVTTPFIIKHGNKTYTVTFTGQTVYVDRAWNPLSNGLNDIKLGDKVTIKGTFNKATKTIEAKIVRDVALPVNPVESTSDAN